MKRNQLFPSVNGFLHGGDYNPEQWLDRPDILEKDIELMKEAHINVVTLGVFSWSTYERKEGQFNFDWLENIMNRLYENGIYTILATPSGARPAWLDAKYPDAMRCDDMGVRAHHGVRHNHCMTSINYRNKVKIMDTKLAERFSNHPGLLMWHISNELGGYCYCPSCRNKFQEWLKDRYHNNIDELNKAWWTTFWSHTFNSFEEIDPPYKNGENCVLGLNLDWKRFSTYSATDFMKFEIDTLHAVKPGVPTTTNFMDMFWDYDYHYMSKFIDYISWDNYPAFHNDYETEAETYLNRAFNHALFRSLKPGQPFMLMESAPGTVNWHPVNKCHRPGAHKLSALQAVAGGSDTVQYFQIRKSRGSSEQFHGAVIDHIGTNDTRVFTEVKELGQILSNIGEITGTVSDNKVALIFDWDNRWAIDDAWTLAKETKQFDKTCMNTYNAFMHFGIEPDIISSDMDFSQYKVIVAPMLYLLHDGVGDKIKEFVKNGGQFMATYFTGYVDKSLLTYLGGFPGQGLSEVFGLKSEEIDALYPTDRNTISLNGKSIEVKDYQELLREVSADVLAKYEGDYVAGTPAITRNAYGLGNAYYVACRTKQSDLYGLYSQMLSNAGIDHCPLPEDVEVHSRFDENYKYTFIFNFSSSPARIENISGQNLLSNETISGHLLLKPMDVAIIKASL